MIKKNKNKIIKDVFKAYLVKNSKFTCDENYPIIEEWMVSDKIPKEIIQWNRRKDVKKSQDASICFYCDDRYFMSILNQPWRYIKILKQYDSVIGLDYSPYDDMPSIVQKHNIFMNLAITSYFARNGIKIIPNVRLGNDTTLSSLDAYPKNTLIAIGTNGFIKTLSNKTIFVQQFQKIVSVLKPSGICIYGKALPEMIEIANENNINVYQFDSYTIKQNKLDKQLERGVYERK